jgi:hypothetical protein
MAVSLCLSPVINVFLKIFGQKLGTGSTASFFIDAARTFTHGAPRDYVFKKYLSPPHDGLPEPVRVLLISHAGAYRLCHGTRKSG